MNAERLPTIELEDIKTVICAFDEGIFVRDITRDSQPGFAIRLIKPLAALARLKKATDFLHHGTVLEEER